MLDNYVYNRIYGDNSAGTVIQETAELILFGPFSRGKGPRAIRNKHLGLTNQVHPVTGVPFSKRGFPNFKQHLYKGGPNEVRITPTGTREGDFAAANRAAGYTRTPEGHTWHHHQTYGKMQLVDETIHAKTGHTGGYSLWYGK